MTQKTWNSLSFFEQLSNIDGEVRRLVSSHEKHLKDSNSEDFSEYYLSLVQKLIRMTMFDPKNSAKGYRYIELDDEVGEIKRYILGEVSSDYILEYWDEYTRAIS